MSQTLLSHGSRRLTAIIRLSSLGLSFLLLAACSAKFPIHVDASSRTTLAGYRTYAWMAPPPDSKSSAGDSVFDGRLQSAVENALAGKGYVRNPGAPDMLVMLRADVDEKYSDTIGEYFRYRDAGGTQPLFSAFSLGYEEATISIEVYDTATRVLLWRGRTAVAMDATHRDRRAVASVAELLKTFPTRPG